MNFGSTTRGLTALSALSASGCALFAMTSSCDCSSAPVITDQRLLAIDAVIVDGHNFGDHGSLLLAGTSPIVVSSKAPGVTWTDTRIVAPLPLAAQHGGANGVTVQTDAGTSEKVFMLEYTLDTRPIAPTSDTDARALAVVDTQENGLFVNQEFHRDLQHIAPIPEALSPPRAPDPGPFAVYFEHFCLNGTCSDDVDIRTQTSVLGEDVIVDPLGRVWYSEGGALLYEQRASHLDPSKQVMTLPNHSRIVMFDPSASSSSSQFRVYNLPGDRNELIGLAWDPATSKLWFCEGGRVGGNKLGRLDPEVAHFDTSSPSFDFSTDPDSTGFEFFPLPDALKGSFPAMPLVDDDGHVWFTMYLGNAIGRLDPATRAFEVFPLPKPRTHKGPGALFNTGGPWRIGFVDGGASVVVGEQYDFEITKLDAVRVRTGDAACAKLDAHGANACTQSLALPEDPDTLADDGTSLLHSITVDIAGNIWFTEMGGTGRANDDRIGVVNANFDGVTEIGHTGSLGGPNGIAVVSDGNSIFFAEFNGHALGALILPGIVD